jgi:hypothetical protein
MERLVITNQVSLEKLKEFVGDDRLVVNTGQTILKTSDGKRISLGFHDVIIKDGNNVTYGGNGVYTVDKDGRTL